VDYTDALNPRELDFSKEAGPGGNDLRTFVPYRAPWFAGVAWGGLLCAAYPLLILAPLAVLAFASPAPTHAWFVEIGVACAVVAFTILAFQFVISARLRWVEAPFGLDVLLQLHRSMAFVAMVLLCIHPLLIAAGTSWGLLTRWRVHWLIWLGRLALLLLLTHVAVALFRGLMRLRYETWRCLHNITAFLLLGLAFVHSLAFGGDFGSSSARVVWVALPLVAWSTWFYGRVVRPGLLASNSYKVVSIASEAPRVWTLTLEAPKNWLLDYAPGQFQFLRLHSNSILAEEHPFSIASSPSPGGRISVTIKECGDFTSTIGRIQPGDLATVHGPFGRFSHVFSQDTGDLVFVAAGIGITPLMSMLRYMRDRADSRRVLLIYANRSVTDIVFRKELESIESRGCPALKTIHILSQPPADWRGRTGRLDTASLGSLCGGFASKAFFICCPPTMASSLIRGLGKAGVAPHRIQADYFGL
jgi:3-phenylpropionate/trans-cinnamate dioxygenase ferredoxin reductase subunit